MFRKKPVIIEAMQWGGSVESGKAIEAWSGGRAICREYEHGIFIETLEGRMTARARDWIIKGVHGKYYPCKPDIFAETYEPSPTDGADSATGKGQDPHK